MTKAEALQLLQKSLKEMSADERKKAAQAVKVAGTIRRPVS